MTFDKYFAMRFPHKAVMYSTPRRARLIVAAIFLFVLIYNIPHLFLTELLGDRCLGFAVKAWYTKFYSWFSFVLNCIVPFILLVYMNYCIVKVVSKNREKFHMSALAEVSSYKENGSSKITDFEVKNSKNNKMKNTERQLTTMLLLVTALFLILMLPTYVRFILLTFLTLDTPRKYANLFLVYHISHKLYHTNSGINFSLYLLSGSRFRRDLKELFCCSGQKRKKSTSHRLDSQSELSAVTQSSTGVVQSQKH